ncbi:hypothetical protein ACP70R_034199 [Stipagrostis hirtigluma subsp. patula]
MALAASTGPAASMASELVARGRESAAALEALLHGAPTAPAPAPHGSLRELAAQILRCCDRALAALHSEGVVDAAAGGSPSRKRRSPPGAAAQTRPRRRARAAGAEVPTRVEQRSSPEDGFLWRKYGQKDIQNSKYPRTYFRCSYKHDNGCVATRQVQQLEEDPSLYVVTYFGEHTCGMDAAAGVGDDEQMRQLVINFGSSTASRGSPWPSSSDDDVRSQSVCLSEEEGGQRRANGCKVKPAPPEFAPPVEPSLSADVSCVTPELESLFRSFDWDYFGESSFDIVDELFNFNEIN